MRQVLMMGPNRVRRGLCVQFAPTLEPSSIFLAVGELVRRDNAQRAKPAFSPLTDLFADVPELRFLDFCHTSETANREIAELVTPLVSSRGTRAFLSDSRNKAAAASLTAMARPDGELSRATLRTGWQSLFEELRR